MLCMHTNKLDLVFVCFALVVRDLGSSEEVGGRLRTNYKH